MIVDAHQHFWRPARGDYGWLTPEMEALYRDFGPADLEPMLAAAGVSATVIVQAAPSVAETEFLLEVAEQWPTARAVVGWVELDAPTARGELERLAARPAFRGVRPMIQDEPDLDWMLRPALGEGLKALVELGLSLDALVRPGHLANLRVLVDRHPDLPVVIDHGGKPDIAGEGFDAWACEIQALGDRPHVMCKLSGLLTEAGARTSDAELAPYVDHLLACFGPARLMWGSDWPVLTLAGDYGGWMRQARRLLAGLSSQDQTQIFGRTAADFYRFGEIG